ncbi:MAG: addiction module protein [Acidobacteria bacterium]|nr:addiction module protein [Acidobacteriota bacterium]
MSKVTPSVLADALRLAPDARAELAAELLASLDGPADPGAAAAWDAEVDRRIDAIEAGTAGLEFWDDVKSRVGKELLGR